MYDRAAETIRDAFVYSVEDMLHGKQHVLASPGPLTAAIIHSLQSNGHIIPPQNIAARSYALLCWLIQLHWLERALLTARL